MPFIEIIQQDSFFQDGFEGILGVAYQTIAQPRGNAPSTFLDAVVKAENLRNVFGLQLCGIRQPLLQGMAINNNEPILAGQWVVGGRETETGTRLFAGEMVFSPLVQEKWYVVTVTNLGIDTMSLGLPCKEYNSPQALIDSGTSNISLPPKVYRAFVDQLKREAVKAIPNFPLRYFEEELCCDANLCDPRNPNADILKLPTMFISFALDDGGTDKHFTVGIPPQYYFRPVLSSRTRANCRAFGISEGKYTVLGDVFMDGLYVYHDREAQQIGIAVADNCPNNAVSKKTISPAQNIDDWCNCLSDDERKDTLVAGYFPGSERCFFMFWWMYLVLFSFAVVLLTFIYLIYMCCKRKRPASQAQTLKVESPLAMPQRPRNNTMGETAILDYDPAIHPPRHRNPAFGNIPILGNQTGPVRRRVRSNSEESLQPPRTNSRLVRSGSFGADPSAFNNQGGFQPLNAAALQNMNALGPQRQAPQQLRRPPPNRDHRGPPPPPPMRGPPGQMQQSRSPPQPMRNGQQSRSPPQTMRHGPPPGHMQQSRSQPNGLRGPLAPPRGLPPGRVPPGHMQQSRSQPNGLRGPLAPPQQRRGPAPGHIIAPPSQQMRGPPPGRAPMQRNQPPQQMQQYRGPPRGFAPPPQQMRNPPQGGRAPQLRSRSPPRNQPSGLRAPPPQRPQGNYRMPPPMQQNRFAPPARPGPPQNRPPPQRSQQAPTFLPHMGPPPS